MDYIDRIKEALKQPGKTQRGLSKALGSDLTIANKIIKRKRRLQGIEIAPAAKYLEVSTEWLMTGKDEGEQPGTNDDNKLNDQEMFIEAILRASIKTGENPTEKILETRRNKLRNWLLDDAKEGIKSTVSHLIRLAQITRE